MQWKLWLVLPAIAVLCSGRVVQKGDQLTLEQKGLNDEALDELEDALIAEVSEVGAKEQLTPSKDLTPQSEEFSEGESLQDVSDMAEESSVDIEEQNDVSDAAEESSLDIDEQNDVSDTAEESSVDIEEQNDVSDTAEESSLDIDEQKDVSDTAEESSLDIDEQNDVSDKAEETLLDIDEQSDASDITAENDDDNLQSLIEPQDSSESSQETSVAGSCDETNPSPPDTTKKPTKMPKRKGNKTGNNKVINGKPSQRKEGGIKQKLNGRRNWGTPNQNGRRQRLPGSRSPISKPSNRGRSPSSSRPRSQSRAPVRKTVVK